jgi:hypothetical protein
MASGALSLTAVRLLGPHLRAENQEWVLSRAANGTRADIEALVAELNPQPDAPATVRKLPAPKGAEPTPVTPPATAALLFPTAASGAPPTLSAGIESAGFEAVGIESASIESASIESAGIDSPGTAPTAPTNGNPPTVPIPRAQRPVVRASAPERYRVQFTIGQESHDNLRRVQALLRREIPGGDTGIIFERALALLLAAVEKEKLGAGTRPRRVIRPETDKPGGDAKAADGTADAAARRMAQPVQRSRSPVPSRHIPKQVKAAAWKRDGAQCAFVAPSGIRCSERSYLEFHHVQPFARQGPATPANISLRCRRHNQYEAELDFGPWFGSRAQAGEVTEA